ncbi:MAG: anti-sigma factor antagonist [Clostridia bacterium]|nr:anti-sigma factor antagonist [Clostridia bacterium]
MKISFKRKGSLLTVQLDGELDQHCAGEIRCAIDARIKSESRIKTLLIDLEKVSFMDSSGIGVILGRYRLMRDLGGELNITNAQKTVEKLLRLSGVYSLLDMKRRGRANG